ncbi:hypothetical protein EBR25_02830 [bacterium]|jgi:hypothetical protein|nr:hypothetical protein [bacterium]
MLKLRLVASYLVLSGVSVFVLAACSWVPLASQTEISAPVQIEQDAPPSVSMDILDEVNDGKMLSLVLDIVPRAQIEADSIEIAIKLFSHGSLVRENGYRLSQLRALRTLKPVGEATLSADVSSRVLLQQPLMEGITDYQIEANWGHAKNTPPESLDIIEHVEVQEFPAECRDECFVPFELRVSLKNPFEKPIGNIWLSTSFERPGGVETATGDPGKFSLGERYLEPQEHFNLSLRTQTPLPYNLYQQGFRPAIRLSSFEFLSEGH